MKQLLLSLIVLASCAVPAAWGGEQADRQQKVPPEPPERDHEIQIWIGRVVEGTQHGDFFPMLGKLAAQFPEERSRASQRLTLQVALWLSTLRGEADIANVIGGERILQCLVYDDRHVLAAALPHVESRDRGLASACMSMVIVRARVVRDHFGRPTFEDLRGCLLPDWPHPNARVVKLMYKRDPLAAVLTMGDTQLKQDGPRWREETPDELERDLRARREIEWALHLLEANKTKWRLQKIGPGKVEPETAAAMQSLARSEYWWVRLYAAHEMNQVRAFARADLVQALREDAHVLVRQKMEDFDPRPDDRNKPWPPITAR